MDATAILALITRLLSLLKTQGPTIGAIAYAVYLASQGDYQQAIAAILAAFGVGTVTHQAVQARQAASAAAARSR